jgi:subtilisin family serine protease
MSCCTPAGLTYLRNLIGRRHDIAVFPPDALEQAQPPETVYFYRPGEILVPVEQTGEFEAVAKRLRLRYVRLDDTPQEGSSSPEVAAVYQHARHHPDVAAFFRDRPEGTEVARYLLGAKGLLEDVLLRLERASAGRLHVSPNHVWFSCPEWHLNPYGDPKPHSLSALERDMSEDVRPMEVMVAVVDSGLPRHYTENAILARVTVNAPASNEEEHWAYEDPSKILQSPDGHGTFVAGVVRINAPGVEVRSYLTLDPDGVIDQTDLIARIALALEERPQVINLSLGGPTRHNRAPAGFGAIAAAAAERDGPIIVAAAGNMATERLFWPAAETWVIAVGAVEITGDPSRPLQAVFSDFGDWVDACANGVDVVSTYEANAYRPSDPPGPVEVFHGAATWSGTSFAAPMVAAVIAGHISSHPGLTMTGALQHLASLGGGRIPGLGIFVP